MSSHLSSGSYDETSWLHMPLSLAPFHVKRLGEQRSAAHAYGLSTF